MRRVLRGLAGTAELQQLDRFPDNPGWEATLASWFLVLPGQSVCWSCYAMTVIHLRDIAGVSPAKKHFAEAEYELVVAALDPELNPQPHQPQTHSSLQPVNLVYQFTAATDDVPRRLLLHLAGYVVQGHLPAEPMFSSGPDSEHHALWKSVIDSYLEKDRG